MNGPQNSRFASFSQDRQNPGQVQKKSVARFRTGPKYTARCMDVQLGVWKVVPRAEVFVHRRYCWLGFVAQKRFSCYLVGFIGVLKHISPPIYKPD